MFNIIQNMGHNKAAGLFNTAVQINRTDEVVDMTGPEHNRMFVMQVKLGDRVIGKGSGRTKQAAGQEAAYHAILALKNKQEH